MTNRTPAMVPPLSLWRRDFVGDHDAEQVELAVLHFDQGHRLGRDADARWVRDLTAGAFPTAGLGQGIADRFMVGTPGALDSVSHEVDPVIAERREHTLWFGAKLPGERVAELGG